MNIPIKSRREIELMRNAGRVVFRALERCREHARPGVTTAELDALVMDTCLAAGAYSVFKNYPTYEPGAGFPGNTCISVNDEVVHGIPGPRKLLDGDIVSVDCGLRLRGYIGDAAITVAVGTVSDARRNVIRVTQETLDMAIREVRPGVRWSSIARRMQEHVESHKFSCVREFVGHGVGKKLHEDPKVPNFVSREFLKRGDFFLESGMVLAIEPMVIEGHSDVVILDDGWTVVTKDGSCAAHIEHTVAVTPNGADVLTDGG